MTLIINGLTLKENREKFGLTQERLAEIVEVSRKTINNYENNGNIPASKIKLFRKIFEEMGGKVTQNTGIINNGSAKKINQNSNNTLENKDFDKMVELFKKQLDKKDEQLDKKDKLIDKLLDLLGSKK